MILFIYNRIKNCLTVELWFCLPCTFSQESEDKESRRRKVCRCGAGVEVTPNMCDTPGFLLRVEPELKAVQVNKRPGFHVKSRAPETTCLSRDFFLTMVKSKKNPFFLKKKLIGWF